MNRMQRLLAKVAFLPASLRKRAQSFLLGRGVPFVGTGGLRVDEITQQRVVIHVANRRRVRNHLKGVHAAAMSLLAETATGFAIAMHIPDDKFQVIKSLNIDYLERAHGGLTAVAELGPEQIEAIRSQPKGEVAVPVTVTDEKGATPIACEAIWAWRPMKRH